MTEREFLLEIIVTAVDISLLIISVHILEMSLMNYDDNKMIVTDYGICIRQVVEDNYFRDSVVITKEAFIEAYNRWIKGTNNE